MKLVKKLGIMLIAISTMLFTNGIETLQAEENTEVPRSVLSIDAGRKYFSEDQLKEIIEGAYQRGYTSVQILLGNDGLRLLLDDMTITVNDKIFTSDSVKKGIELGNNHYYNDPNGNTLTQAEMDRVIAYALERDIDIIPVINSPGHMDSILFAMEHIGLTDVRYTSGSKVSERTVNIENEEAVKFTQELTKLYVEYFGRSGVSEIFNFGADEYANDVFTSPGWGNLQSLGLYDKFIDYANTLAAIIKAEGMRPMSFNDGIYYNSKDEYGTFDKDIIISYWTAGWWGFNVAKPNYFTNKGHDILNTNDGWYWVLGRMVDADGGYHFESASSRTKTIGFTDIPGDTQNTPSIGSMQAIWADEPSADHGIDNILELMTIFSDKHRAELVRPADYTLVDDALRDIPEDLSLYTEETVTALTDAINAITRGLKETQQDEVNKMAEAITNAFNALEYKKADYSRVNSAIETAKKLIEEHYVDFTKVKEAVEAVVRDLDITQQAKVDAMADTIEEAIENLVMYKADYSKVDEAIKKAEKLDKTKYTNFDEVSKAIDAVVRDLGINEQARVDKMAEAIENALNNLKVKKGVTVPTGLTSNMIVSAITLLGAFALVTILKKKRA